MGKSETITKFLERGVLLSPKLLERIGDETPQTLQEPKADTIVLSSLQEPETSFTFNKIDPKKHAEVKDIIEYYGKKYTTIKAILLQKTNPVSISKLNQSNSEQTIIAIVSEKTQRGNVVEDPTGKIEAVHNNQLSDGSVLAFIGEKKDNIFVIKSIIFPDVIINKKSVNQQPHLIFKFEGGNPKIISGEGHLEGFQTPTTIKIKKETETKILVYRPDSTFSKTDSQQTLLLRCLPEPKIPSENYIIAEEPDIFWIVQKEEWKEKYNDVLIISGENAEVNVSSKEQAPQTSIF